MTPQEIKKMEQPKNDPARKGAFTSEFVFAILSCVMTLAIIGGWVDPEGGASMTDKIAAIVGVALTSCGYTYGRSAIKREQIKADAE
jgi:hypothetical protein